jgi:hypothetical protein
VVQGDPVEEAKVEIEEKVSEQEEVKEPEAVLLDAVPARSEDAQQETDKIDTKE